MKMIFLLNRCLKYSCSLSLARALRAFDDNPREQSDVNSSLFANKTCVVFNSTILVKNQLDLTAFNSN